MTMWIHRRRPTGDEGSLMIAMLSILVVTSLVAVVLATVVSGQNQTRFDNSFERALQVAEYGLDELAAKLQADATAEPSEFDVYDATSDSLLLEGEVASGGTFVTTATKSAEHWDLESVGTSPEGRVRTIQARIEVTGLFNLAVFGKIFTDFNGGNGASSYDSAVDSSVCEYGKAPATKADVVAGDFNVEPCFSTGKGIVATNGELFLKGQASEDADAIEIHNAKDAEYLDGLDPLPDATGTCIGVTQTCDYYDTFIDTDGDGTPDKRKLSYYRKPIELAPINVCDGLGAASPFNGVGTLGGGVHNFTDVVLRESTVFTGTMEFPTIICMSGKLTIGNGQAVNFETVAGGTQPRPPGSLLIFNRYAGTGTGLDLGNHAAISAAIYAPDASFQGGSQGNVFGSLIAHSIDNNGGWNFHYDEALGGVKVNAPVRMTEWTEI